jgi:5,6-dimethylbenzimidazole synthase
MRLSALALLHLVLTVAPGLSGQEFPANRPGLSLRETFDRYVRSVQAGDLEGLFTTVTDREEMFFLTASGKMIDGREGYRRFHQDWFSESGWRMPVELLRVEEGGDLGFTLAVFRFRQEMPDGSTHNLDSYFTLVWRREEGEWRVVGDVCSPIERYFTTASGGRLYSVTQRQVIETLLERRTVRRFTPAPVPEEHLRIVLEAARHAPTAGNQQPWRFLVVRDREKLNALKEAARDRYMERYRAAGVSGEITEARRQVERSLEGVLSAPIYIAVLADREAPYPEYAIQDATLAAGNLMNAARALGYGTGFFTTFFPDEVMRPLFGIPERYTMVCFTPLGVPEAWPDTPMKKPLEELIVEGRFKGS